MSKEVMTNDSLPPSSMEQSNKTPSSDSARKQMKICKPDKRGFCLQHKCDMKKCVVSSKKWVDPGGGKGFGWTTPHTIYEVYSGVGVILQRLKQYFQEVSKPVQIIYLSIIE